ncbi:hypothetical protein LCGC14_0373560 [marine sediment metagenome]|uniref:Uncharacterized protein n=1 Tax=marine sediment metagenome TaxID=412755 RepID=A0A0F9VRQ1_9ZZZZ
MGRKKRRKGSALGRTLTRNENGIVRLSGESFDDCEDEDFRRSLVTQWRAKGCLSERQWTFVRALNTRLAILRRLGESKPSRKKPEVFYVYAIEADNAVKIGFSGDPNGRARALQTVNAYAVKVAGLIPCDTKAAAKKLERRLHKLGREHHMRGEWFRPSILGVFYEKQKSLALAAVNPTR